MNERLDEATRNGLLTLVSARIDEHWFGHSFPEQCGDGYAYAGTDLERLKGTMLGYQLVLPPDIDAGSPPSDAKVLDLLEFSYEVIAEATPTSFHSHMGHHHYAYDKEAGRSRFADEARLFT